MNFYLWVVLRRWIITMMGEKEPSIEFEAYSIQRIAQDLFDMYEASEKP